MALSFFLPTYPEPTIALSRLYLRPPVRHDWVQWAKLRSESKEFLIPWEPTWPSDALSKSAFRRRLNRYSEDWSNDRGYSFSEKIYVNDLNNIPLGRVDVEFIDNDEILISWLSSLDGKGLLLMRKINSIFFFKFFN